jgi:hypothetical protein
MIAQSLIQNLELPLRNRASTSSDLCLGLLVSGLINPWAPPVRGRALARPAPLS